MTLSPEILDDLRDVYATGDLVIFVGSGISRAAGLPNWEELVKQLRDRMVREAKLSTQIEEVDELIRQRRFIDALSGAKLAFGEHEFNLTVEKAVDDKSLPIPDAALAIAELAPALRGVITTNLDRFVERAFQGQWQDFSTPPGDLAQRRGYIFKPHGTRSNPDTWVFTRDEYDKATFGCPQYRHIIEALFRAYPILFVGAGLADDDLDQILGATRALAGAKPPRHFAMIKAPIAPFRRASLEKSGIRLLEYADHLDVPKILRALP